MKTFLTLPLLAVLALTAVTAAVYQCPMHPWIKSDHADAKCTICGKALVAAFVGMPPMNFFEGTLERESTGLVFVEGSNDPSGKPYKVPVPAERAQRLVERSGGVLGKPIVLGVRPQMFTETAGPATMTMPVRPTFRPTNT